MIRVDSVSLQRGRRHLLSDINLYCEPGSVTVLMGPNGAGKSSLLKVMSGEYSAEQGNVSLHEKNLADWPQKKMAQTMAVLPQHSVLDFPFTVEEVVLLGRIPHATGLVRDREIVQAALRLADGASLSQRVYTQLSGGEKQRVQLARVLAQVWPGDEEQNNCTNCLLLDEPSASFDLSHQQLLLSIVRQFADQGGTVVMVMHDLNLAASCADQLVMIHHGEIVAKGVPETVLNTELIAQVFGVQTDIVIHPKTAKPFVML